MEHMRIPSQNSPQEAGERTGLSFLGAVAEQDFGQAPPAVEACGDTPQGDGAFAARHGYIVFVLSHPSFSDWYLSDSRPHAGQRSIERSGDAVGKGEQGF
jgi:hypothetical protein